MCFVCNDPQDRYDAIDQTATAYDRVQRWDVYEIADALAEMPALLRCNPALIYELTEEIEDLVSHLYAAANIGGRVSPSDWEA
jgi:hypothetical protein